jgi:hypothetical protein
MDPRPNTQIATRAEDDQEWELTDEDLDRTATDPVRSSSIRSTSRPCSCSRCHCR